MRRPLGRRRQSRHRLPGQRFDVGAAEVGRSWASERPRSPGVASAASAPESVMRRMRISVSTKKTGCSHAPAAGCRGRCCSAPGPPSGAGARRSPSTAPRWSTAAPPSRSRAPRWCSGAPRWPLQLLVRGLELLVARLELLDGRLEVLLRRRELLLQLAHPRRRPRSPAVARGRRAVRRRRRRPRRRPRACSGCCVSGSWSGSDLDARRCARRRRSPPGEADRRHAHRARSSFSACLQGAPQLDVQLGAQQLEDVEGGRAGRRRQVRPPCRRGTGGSRGSRRPARSAGP